MKWLALALPAALALLALSVRAEEPASQDERGREVFTRQCAPCHGAGPGDDGSEMLPGTAALAQKYQGTRPAALELRDDLPAPVLQLFVRRGIGAMSPFRPSELSDADIAAVAAYLAEPD